MFRSWEDRKCFLHTELQISRSNVMLVSRNTHCRLSVDIHVRLSLNYGCIRACTQTITFVFLYVVVDVYIWKLYWNDYSPQIANDLRINRSRCGKRQLRLSHFLFKEWNEIPLDIRNSESVGIFKNALYCLM